MLLKSYDEYYNGYKDGNREVRGYTSLVEDLLAKFPIGERIAQIRARKSEERARAKEKLDRRARTDNEQRLRSVARPGTPSSGPARPGALSRIGGPSRPQGQPARPQGSGPRPQGSGPRPQAPASRGR